MTKLETILIVALVIGLAASAGLGAAWADFWSGGDAVHYVNKNLYGYAEALYVARLSLESASQGTETYIDYLKKEHEGIDAIISACNIKDPQVVLPGWADDQLEFGSSYALLILVGENGVPYLFFNTDPGWYQIPVNIENVVMCCVK